MVNVSGGTTYGSTANYNCISGYYLSHVQTRTCTSSGSWSLSAPTCVPNGTKISKFKKIHITILVRVLIYNVMFFNGSRLTNSSTKSAKTQIFAQAKTMQFVCTNCCIHFIQFHKFEQIQRRFWRASSTHILIQTCLVSTTFR